MVCIVGNVLVGFVVSLVMWFIELLLCFCVVFVVFV